MADTPAGFHAMMDPIYILSNQTDIESLWYY
jgi:hypothetical protein